MSLDSYGKEFTVSGNFQVAQATSNFPILCQAARPHSGLPIGLRVYDLGFRPGKFGVEFQGLEPLNPKP